VRKRDLERFRKILLGHREGTIGDRLEADGKQSVLFGINLEFNNILDQRLEGTSVASHPQIEV
jgi:hypothetical protein